MAPKASFRLAPPIPGKWQVPSSSAKRFLHERLRETGFFSKIDQPNEAVRVLPLPFYPGWLLCDLPTIDRRDTEPMRQGRGAHSLLYGPDGFTALDGTSPPIHAHNALHGVSLDTADKILGYLRFFCFFIRGQHGPFEIVDDAQHFTVPARSSESVNTAHVLAPDIIQDFDGKRAIVKATIFHAECFYEANFEIAATGPVSMTDDATTATGVVRNPALSFVNTLRFLKDADSAGS